MLEIKGKNINLQYPLQSINVPPPIIARLKLDRPMFILDASTKFP